MLFANSVFNVLIGILIVRIVFFVFSIMFGKTSLLFLLHLHSIIPCELCFLR